MEITLKPSFLQMVLLLKGTRRLCRAVQLGRENSCLIAIVTADLARAMAFHKSTVLPATLCYQRNTRAIYVDVTIKMQKLIEDLRRITTKFH
jgi:hypothetical protein